MRRRSGTPKWTKEHGHPPFKAGDMVGLNGNYRYPGWAHGEQRVIIEVEYSEFEDRWALAISNPQSPYGVSKYNPRNFTKDTVNMAYERTKFFAAKITNGDLIDAQLDGEMSNDVGDPLNTPMRDSKYQVQQDVAKIIKHGEKWLVLQTVAMIEGEEPRPPIRITEYK